MNLKLETLLVITYGKWLTSFVDMIRCKCRIVLFNIYISPNRAVVGSAVLIYLITGNVMTKRGCLIGMIEDVVNGLTNTGSLTRRAAVRSISRNLLAGCGNLCLGQAGSLSGTVSIRVAVEVEISGEEYGNIAMLILNFGANVQHLTNVVNTPLVNQLAALARGHRLKALVIGADDRAVHIDHGKDLARLIGSST